MRKPRYSIILRWLGTAAWTALTVLLMTLPAGEDSMIDELSGLFGGSDLTDAIGHVILFGVLTALWRGTLALHGPPARALRLAVIIAVLLGTATEASRVLVAERGAAPWDLLANWLGAGLAALWAGRRNGAGAVR